MPGKSNFEKRKKIIDFQCHRFLSLRVISECFFFFYQELDGLQSGLKKKAESSFDCDAKLIGLQVSLSVLQVNSGSFKLQWNLDLMKLLGTGQICSLNRGFIISKTSI